MSLQNFFTLAFLAFVLVSRGSIATADDPAAHPIDFNREIRPILSNRCFACHGPDAAKRQGVGKPLRLDTEIGAFEDLGGYSSIVRRKPDESELIRRVKADDPDDVMPPPKHAAKLSEAEIDRLVRWVEQGAPYARHWAYARPTRPALPEVKNACWAKNPVDRFLLARIDKEGLTPSPEADRNTLIRRLSLDLTGLPPKIEEVENFNKDTSADAYENLVDNLLSRPTYGEHAARQWLDLARYADSAGYADDPARTIWAYRDYVIRSFNANKPFDRFTLEQIAGDLLPDASEETRIATAFHRNTMTNNEGGTNDEEFRNAAVVDRVNTTMAVWMGTTLACAQCHDHKYDPLSQADYFRVFAFFNNTQDADRGDESPTIGLSSTDHEQKKAALKAEIERLRNDLRADFDAPELNASWTSLSGLEKKLAGWKPETTVPVLAELPPNARRKTKIQRRGNFLDLGDEVSEGVPEAIYPMVPGAPRDRLALARWLVSVDNPLTARVVVNRAWEQVFGSGLVPTSEDFGSQGEPPTHPELLDWLATDFVDHQWDLKNLVRLLVTSQAYRQSSKVTPEGLRLDPANQWLARGPRFRLSAETVRDQALAIAGLLSPKMYGPPVRPPQPSSGLTDPRSVAGSTGRPAREKTGIAEGFIRRGGDRTPTHRCRPSTPPTERFAPSDEPGPTHRSRRW